MSNAPAGFSDGVDNDTLYTAGTGLVLNGQNQFSVSYAGSGVNGAAARSDHSHFGADWIGSSTSAGLFVHNTAANGTGGLFRQGGGSGYLAPSSVVGLWGDAHDGAGLLGTSLNHTAVSGIALGTLSAAIGVGGQTASPSGRGVQGTATATTDPAHGVYGETNSISGAGVVAVGSGTSRTALRVTNGAIRISGAGVNSPTAAFIHQCTEQNTTVGFYTTIDNPMCNGDPSAILIVTPRGRDVAFSLHTSPITAVIFDAIGDYGPPNRWVLFNISTDDVFETGDDFNILIIKP